MRLYIEGWTTDMGHSRPSRLRPTIVFVRYCSVSDQNGASRRMTRSARSGLMHCNKQQDAGFQSSPPDQSGAWSCVRLRYFVHTLIRWRRAMPKISGSCLCGAVRYECNAEPLGTAICHLSLIHISEPTRLGM